MEAWGLTRDEAARGVSARMASGILNHHDSLTGTCQVLPPPHPKPHTPNPVDRTGNTRACAQQARSFPQCARAVRGEAACIEEPCSLHRGSMEASQAGSMEASLTPHSTTRNSKPRVCLRRNGSHSNRTHFCLMRARLLRQRALALCSLAATHGEHRSALQSHSNSCGTPTCQHLTLDNHSLTPTPVSSNSTTATPRTGLGVPGAAAGFQSGSEQQRGGGGGSHATFALPPLSRACTQAGDGWEKSESQYA